MASTINPEGSPVETWASEPEKATNVGNSTNKLVVVEVVLRVLLFATTLVSVVVIATGKQTELIPIPFPPFGAITVSAKFTDSPAFIYFIAALSVACLYSIISTLLSFLALMKRAGSSKIFMSHFVVIDVVLLGIVASATGTAAAVAYIGLRGNSKVQWNKICNVYDSFCRHTAISVLFSLLASIVLIFLILLYIITLSRRARK